MEVRSSKATDALERGRNVFLRGSGGLLHTELLVGLLVQAPTGPVGQGDAGTLGGAHPLGLSSRRYPQLDALLGLGHPYNVRRLDSLPQMP